MEVTITNERKDETKFRSVAVGEMFVYGEGVYVRTSTSDNAISNAIVVSPSPKISQKAGDPTYFTSWAIIKKVTKLDVTVEN